MTGGPRAIGLGCEGTKVFQHAIVETRAPAQGVRAVTIYPGRMASVPQLHRFRTSNGLTAGTIGGVD
jgi:hypothetical protein